MDPQIVSAPAVVIPDGVYDLTAAADNCLRAASDAPPRRGDAAHPVFAFVMALGGMGWGIADVAAAIGLDFGAGPVLATCRLDWHQPLRTGRRYGVAARVAGLERRASHSLGAADHLLLAMTVGEGSAVAAKARLRIVFRVPGASGQPAPAAPDAPGGAGPVLRRIAPLAAAPMAVWCALMRDDNAIHTDRAAAERAGFGPRCVNPGPANLAFVLDALAAARPGASFGRVEARFLGVVVEGDALAVEAAPGGAVLRRAGGGAPVLAVAAAFADEGGA